MYNTALLLTQNDLNKWRRTAEGGCYLWKSDMVAKALSCVCVFIVIQWQIEWHVSLAPLRGKRDKVAMVICGLQRTSPETHAEETQILTHPITCASVIQTSRHALCPTENTTAHSNHWLFQFCSEVTCLWSFNSCRNPDSSSLSQNPVHLLHGAQYLPNRARKNANLTSRPLCWM